MNPCTSSPLTPTHPHISRGATGAPPSPGNLESHGLQLLEMGTKEQDYDELRDLLQSWDVADLLPHLQDEAINVDELQMIKRHHLSELLRNFRFGTRIRFEHHLERWRRWLNVPLQGTQGQGGSHCSGCRCGEVLVQNQSIGCQPAQMAVAELDEKTEDLTANGPAESLVALSEPPPDASPAYKPRPQVVLSEAPELPMGAPVALGEAVPADGGSSEDRGVSVLGILQSSGMKAQSLLGCLGQNEPLDAVQRLLLIQLVCGYYEDNQLHLTLQRSHLLEREILELFPREQLQFYRTERRGKIYVRFTNMKRNKRFNTTRQDLKRRRADLVKAEPIQANQNRTSYPDVKENVQFGTEQVSSPDPSD
ncbi:hypothetical protein KR074_009115 [Drosophila pseudoananassae]|nr:hypothetical protein KR074_009115 [Drosophila pseudoananassae]